MSEPNLRLLVRNLRTKTTLPNEEVARLRAIEKAARVMIGSEFPRTFGPPLYDVDTVSKLKTALRRKPIA